MILSFLGILTLFCKEKNGWVFMASVMLLTSYALLLMRLSFMTSRCLGFFTYFGSSQNTARSRINRYFFFDGIGACFLIYVKKPVFRVFLDRISIIASSGDTRVGRRPFRFFNV